MLTPTRNWLESGHEYPNQQAEIMRFTIYYDGPLHSAANDSRIKEKHDIRKKLHWQLLQLFRDHPALPKMPFGRDWANWSSWSWPQLAGGAASPWDEALAVVEIGDLHFVPLVRDAMKITCELDILFLRHGGPSVMEGGSKIDIDNRLLTLFDALALPTGAAGNHAIADSALSRTSPIFCLLEDDSRITALNIRTDSLLAPVEGAHVDDVRLIIGVTLKANVATYANLSLIS